jgi:hypothetical protein
MEFKPQVKVDENGYVQEMTLAGNIGGIEIELPENIADYMENFGAYKLIDGKLVKDEQYVSVLLEEKQKKQLRRLRESECFKVINRGILWYNTLTEDQKKELDTWYHQWLDVTETLTVPEVPIWIETT